MRHSHVEVSTLFLPFPSLSKSQFLEPLQNKESEVKNREAAALWADTEQRQNRSPPRAGRARLPQGPSPAAPDSPEGVLASHFTKGQSNEPG